MPDVVRQVVPIGARHPSSLEEPFRLKISALSAQMSPIGEDCQASSGSWRGPNIPFEISSGAGHIFFSQFIVSIVHEHRPEDADQVPSQGSDGLIVCFALRAFFLVVGT